MSFPATFPGTEQERKANYATHCFITTQYSEDDAETRCGNCDCRPGLTSSFWPCGYDVPRVPRPDIEVVLCGEQDCGEVAFYGGFCTTHLTEHHLAKTTAHYFVPHDYTDWCWECGHARNAPVHLGF